METQVCTMTGGVHGRRSDAHLPRLPREDTFVCRFQEQVSEGGRTRGRQLVFTGMSGEELAIRWQ
jgi:hypothetical protein